MTKKPEVYQDEYTWGKSADPEGWAKPPKFLRFGYAANAPWRTKLRVWLTRLMHPFKYRWWKRYIKFNAAMTQTFMSTQPFLRELTKRGAIEYGKQRKP